MGISYRKKPYVLSKRNPFGNKISGKRKGRIIEKIH